MNRSVKQTLIDLANQYHELYQEKLGHPATNSELVGLSSPCIIKEQSDELTWIFVEREKPADFSNVEQAIDLGLHQDLIDFYASIYSADMSCLWNGNELNLLQVWNDGDFERLQENILGHLVTQRRLKLKPTVFIGTTDAELDVISVCNLTGAVILERLGTSKRDILADSVVEFLENLEPRIS